MHKILDVSEVWSWMRMGRSEEMQREKIINIYKHYEVGLYLKVHGKILQNKKQKIAFWKYYSGFNMEAVLEMTKT